MGRNLPHIMATLSSVMPFIHNKDEHSGGKNKSKLHGISIALGLKYSYLVYFYKMLGVHFIVLVQFIVLIYIVGHVVSYCDIKEKILH